MSARLLCRFLHGTLLDGCDARGDADHDARAKNEALARDLLDEEADHALRHLIVGDDARAQRPNRRNIARRPPDHAARLLADRQDASRVAVHGHDRRLAQDDTLALDEDKHIRRSQINSNIH